MIIAKIIAIFSSDLYIQRCKCICEYLIWIYYHVAWKKIYIFLEKNVMIYVYLGLN